MGLPCSLHCSSGPFPKTYLLFYSCLLHHNSRLLITISLLLSFIIDHQCHRKGCLCHHQGSSQGSYQLSSGSSTGHHFYRHGCQQVVTKCQQGYQKVIICQNKSRWSQKVIREAQTLEICHSWSFVISLCLQKLSNDKVACIAEDENVSVYASRSKYASRGSSMTEKKSISSKARDCH